MKPKSDDLKRIEEAVRSVEIHTTGEVVPIIYDKCSNTRFVFPILGFFLWIVVHSFQQAFFPVNYWDANWPLQLGLPPLAGWIVAFFLSQIDWVQRLFISKNKREKAVQDRAELEFYRCGIPLTKEKTGILIFVSLMERYSVVLADKGISEKLPPETWSEILQTLNSQLSYKSLSKGFVPAIEKCGEILAVHFPRDLNDTNELPNYPILRLEDE